MSAEGLMDGELDFMEGSTVLSSVGLSELFDGNDDGMFVLGISVTAFVGVDEVFTVGKYDGKLYGDFVGENVDGLWLSSSVGTAVGSLEELYDGALVVVILPK